MSDVTDVIIGTCLGSKIRSEKRKLTCQAICPKDDQLVEG